MTRWETEMELGIAGKRAVVIGGSQGLGLSVCERFADEGVDLVIFARNAERLAKARAALSARNPKIKVDTVAGDISDAEDIERLKQEVLGTGGCRS